ncbi:MAG: DNA/RNA non-specific endonuclease [Bacteroidota bacterium]|nr:DNA/RNA non-specific endonuclease [Bacteroidota bacterium]
MKQITYFLFFVFFQFLSFGQSISGLVHLTLGNPSKAITNVTSSGNYLLVKESYALSYNNASKIPNWVAWHVSKDWIGGDVKRSNNFRKDETLPDNWIKIAPSEYEDSGFDRGHMCPSGDRTKEKELNSETFLMTNMIPQAPNNNRVTWRLLEEYCRNLVDQGNELYIYSGAIGIGGEGSYGYANYIGKDSILVPHYIWKIILSIPDGENDIQRINNNTSIITILMPNNQTVNERPWWYYTTTVDELEKRTGYDFLTNISFSIQEVLESKKFEKE